MLERRLLSVERFAGVGFDPLDFGGGKRAVGVVAGARLERCGGPRAMRPRLRGERLGHKQVVEHPLHALRAGRELEPEIFRNPGDRLLVVGARQLHPAAFRQYVGRQIRCGVREGGQAGECCNRKRGQKGEAWQTATWLTHDYARRPWLHAAERLTERRDQGAQATMAPSGPSS